MNRSAELNPFRVSQFEALDWQPEPQSLNNIFAAWKMNGFKGQLSGEHGAGKTTLALKLMQMAQQEGCECLHLFANADSLKSDFLQWSEKLKKTSPETLVIFDGIGHSSRWSRRSWLKNTPHFLALVHQPLKRINTICHLQPQEDLLVKLCVELAGDEGRQLIEKSGGADQLLARHRFNLRDCFFELYDLWSVGGS
ncbi:MAG: hypothetical protein HRT88_06145 [Lentisphaeraceae bacterium]|nr:hypothetical protein [Lentisphaeraceae bacterium]